MMASRFAGMSCFPGVTGDALISFLTLSGEVVVFALSPEPAMRAAYPGIPWQSNMISAMIQPDIIPGPVCNIFMVFILFFWSLQ